eukprot:gene33998-biopygen36304
MAEMFDLYNDKTYDALSKRTNSSMRDEHLVLTPALSDMHDAITYCESTMDWLEDKKELPTMEELGKRIYMAHKTFKGAFALLDNRYTMIQLKASMESDTAVHGGTENLSRRRTLPYMDDFLVLVSDRVEALKARDQASRVLVFGNSGGFLLARADVVPAAGGTGRRDATSALGDKMVGNYSSKAQAFKQFSVAEGRWWLPTTEATGLMELSQHWEQIRDALWVQGPEAGSRELCSYRRLLWERGKVQLAQVNDWVQMASGKLGCVPKEGGHFSGHSTRKGACTCAKAVGTALERCCFMGGGSQLPSAIHSYIDPKVVLDEHMERYFAQKKRPNLISLFHSTHCFADEVMVVRCCGGVDELHAEVESPPQ